MSSIIKNAAVLALISGSTQAYRLPQRSNIGVRFIDDSSDIMINDDDFEQESKRQSLGQTQQEMKESMKSGEASADSTQAYENYINEKYNKVTPVKIQTQPPTNVLSQNVNVPKPNVGHFREEQEYNQAQQDKKAGQLMIQSTKAIYGGSSSYNKADPEVQLAIAQANS
jgi:hypothetical protein